MADPTAAALSPAACFDLEGWAHAELFHGLEQVWEALGRLEGYLARFPGGRIEGKVAAGAWLEGDGIVLGAGSRVEPGAYIAGPCIIGRDTEIRHGAYLRGHVLVGDGCVLGHATEVKHSIFLDGARAGHFAYVGDSILGRAVNLGAGTKLANLRLDGRNIRLRTPRGAIDTGARKLGAILADGAETGCNSVTNPGTLLGRGARLHPCAVAGGWWPAGSIITRESNGWYTPPREGAPR